MHQAVPQSQDLETKCKYCVGVYQNADNTHEAKLASSLSFFFLTRGQIVSQTPHINSNIYHGFQTPAFLF